jgi:hypothetical protein
MLETIAKSFDKSTAETRREIKTLTDKQDEFGATLIAMRGGLIEGMKAAISADRQGFRGSIRDLLESESGPLNSRLKNLSISMRQLIQQREIKPPKASPREMLAKVVTCHLYGAAHHMAPAEVASKIYQNGKVEQAVADPAHMIQKGIVSPATTFTATWAAELANIGFLDAFATFAPAMIYSQLAARGPYRLDFSGVSGIGIPARAETPTISGAFVGESDPIPVRRAALSSYIVYPRKLGVISTFTHELFAHSMPSIENVVRTIIQEDTAVTVDTLMLDNQVATAIRPRGLLEGLTSLPPTAGGGTAALLQDIENLVAAIVTSPQSGLLDPVFITDVASAMKIAILAPNAIAAGLTILSGSTVPAGRMILVDAGDFVSGASDDLKFDISQNATIHEEDTAPLPIVGAGGAVATPVRSLWQTATLGLRMLQSMTWDMRRDDRVAFVDGCTW